MEHKRNTTQLFLPLFILALVLFILDRTGMSSFLRGGLERIISPAAKEMHKGTTFETAYRGELLSENVKELDKLRKENEDLRLQLGIAKEIPSQKYMMANVLSTSRLFIIDKGQDDGVAVGSSVIYKNIFVGKVIVVSKRVSRILLPNEGESVISVKTNNTDAKGLLKGQGGKSVLSEVTLSENLTEKDSVVTAGDVDEKGIGIHPGLLVGTIENIRKSDDQLFQEATVVPLVDVKKLEHVFIIL